MAYTIRFSLLPLLLFGTVAAGCDDDDTPAMASDDAGEGPGATETDGDRETDGGSTDTDGTDTDVDDTDTDAANTVTHECGTYELDAPGDSVPPQDPSDDEIVQACTVACEAWTAVEACVTEMFVCLEACRLRSCDVCPGTLAPLVRCETESIAAADCTCSADGVSCPAVDACPSERDATGACGG